MKFAKKVLLTISAPFIFLSLLCARDITDCGGYIAVISKDKGTVVSSHKIPGMAIVMPSSFTISSDAKSVFVEYWQCVDVSSNIISEGALRRENGDFLKMTSMTLTIPILNLKSEVKINNFWKSPMNPLPYSETQIEQFNLKEIEGSGNFLIQDNKLKKEILQVESCSLHLDKSKLYIFSNGYSLNAYSTSSGRILWQVQMPGPGAGPDAALVVYSLSHNLYAANSFAGFYRISPDTGKIIWHTSFSNPYVPPLFLDAGQYFVAAPIHHLKDSSK